MTAFQPIPVLDLMGGQVVRARAGERESYRPLTGSAVASSAVPLAVVESLLRLYPFRSIYMADLDAILGRGDHDATVATIAPTHTPRSSMFAPLAARGGASSYFSPA